ncbi:MAG: hypothetical protein UR11_C0002G0212 [Candidatus Woesebacteria bacterium GW2011_GWC1_30_29]|uniref:Uncharacterized protein n=1 Tax=Candidatus Woesebacteria bacterium GW2011_GWC2_31_9 TaxID=1618586 RepID=A0A0F9Z0S5_9BACT|nr:MAG: hypothetical protein UR11_C0002G0212 [Candidatus Woesebacteria bacterium GW2011_GWC1_30_29]KKP26680.1 MAG: hypothetical protein UR13_C0003G0047 [Candidatus Woesebacteria bacterium GW2011_GWD1_31_12]KKP28080.1 MAG: hypothetical protein UR16_C0001G0101 [Candidatus Woesebacteria bacterium GW2011_GWB1_31_29]KKP31163.1 MAG: hypothetical protein UR20_C0042G0002 [Candidatus Woesebacteria bacterium GW2011_GWE2_31_6]KKP32251.1 MAG: hypothetical protein UR21_C0001G0047 [Candidatus Woesebacteria b
MLQIILDRIISLEKKVGNGNKELKEEIIKNRKRIDKFGIQLAELSDDAPTVEEFDELDQKVKRLENKFATL